MDKKDNTHGNDNTFCTIIVVFPKRLDKKNHLQARHRLAFKGLRHL